MSDPFGERKFDHSTASVNNTTHPIKELQNSKPREKKRLATVSLAGCFGCHMSMLDIDTDLLDVIELVSFD